MNESSTTITLRRDVLARAVEHLPSLDLRVLIYLVTNALPRSRRVSRQVGRVSDDLGVREHLIKMVLGRLHTLGFIEEHPPWIKNVLTLDVGPLLVEDAPEGLPFDHNSPSKTNL